LEKGKKAKAIFNETFSRNGKGIGPSLR